MKTWSHCQSAFDMRCVNCNSAFEKKSKGYQRKSLITKSRSQTEIANVLQIHLAPSTSDDDRFICFKCDKQLNNAFKGEKAKHDLLSTMKEGSLFHKNHAASTSRKATAKCDVSTMTTPETTAKKEKKPVKVFIIIYVNNIKFNLKAKQRRFLNIKSKNGGKNK